MPRTPKTTGPRRLPNKRPGEELWAISGHDGRVNFVATAIVAGGVVRSVPLLLAWMDGRDWLECAQVCVDKGWTVSQVDPERAAASIDQQRARNSRGEVQLGLDLSPPTT